MGMKRNKKDKRENEREGMKPKNLKKRRKKVCIFCAEKRNLDFKELGLIRRFISDRGKILPPRMSGCCTMHQRRVATEIKRARQAGLLPYTVD